MVYRTSFPSDPLHTKMEKMEEKKGEKEKKRIRSDVDRNKNIDQIDERCPFSVIGGEIPVPSQEITSLIT